MARTLSPDEFAAELLASATKAPVEAAKTVKKAAQNIKTEARANVLQTAPTHQAHAHRAITYDEPNILGARVTSEVGYDKDLPGGALGNLLEFGGGGDHSPPHRDLGRAMDDEAPHFEDFMLTMAKKIL